MYHDDYLKLVPEAVRLELEKKHRRKEYDGVDWTAVERACTPYYLGKRFKLGSLSEGMLGRFPRSKEVFCIRSTFPADRSSGGGTIVFESGAERDYVWDYDNPEVFFLGWGKVVTRLEFEEGYPSPPPLDRE